MGRCKLDSRVGTKWWHVGRTMAEVLARIIPVAAAGARIPLMGVVHVMVALAMADKHVGNVDGRVDAVREDAKDKKA